MNEIVTEARSWIGTKFHHQGRVKDHGVDCIGLVVGVMRSLGLEPNDSTNYPPEPDGEKLKAALDAHFISIPIEQMQVGHIVLFRLYKYPQHVGILGDYAAGGLSLIHAYQPIGKVVEHVLDEKWKKRLVGVYGFQNINR